MKLEDLIIEENNNFFAVNKPQGLVVNRAESVKGKTLQDLVEEDKSQMLEDGGQEMEKNKESYNSQSPASIKEEFISRSGVVHRLDKDTSGVLLVAKNPETFQKLKTLFIKREVKKYYYSVVWGNINQLLGDKEYLKIDLPIARNPRNRTKFAIVVGGRDALSHVYVANPKSQVLSSNQSHKSKISNSEIGYSGVAEYKNKAFSFVKVIPKTGRTHQIRIHLKSLHHEILGDKIYCGRKQLKWSDEESITLMLHARRLEFEEFGKNWCLEAPFPKHFVDTVKKIWDSRG